MAKSSAPTLPPPRVDNTWRALVQIVDDDALSARHVGSMIEALGHNVVLTSTWTDALRQFTSNNVDLVLMDAVMPNVDGFKLTRLFREKAHSYVPIVFLTGLTDRESRTRVFDAGADDFLAKPVDDLELQVRLMSMLRIRRLTLALEMRSRSLAKLASIDALTGLLNRRALDERLPLEIQRAAAENSALSLLMLDVDHFKRVNDEHGHDAGDQVLTFLGHVIDELLVENDFAFRFGGEEFCLLLPGAKAQAAFERAEALRTVFEQRSALECKAGKQTLSVGLSSLEFFEATPEPGALLRAADQALYVAKRTGRNRTMMHHRERDPRWSE